MDDGEGDLLVMLDLWNLWCRWFLREVDGVELNPEVLVLMRSLRMGCPPENDEGVVEVDMEQVYRNLDIHLRTTFFPFKTVEIKQPKGVTPIKVNGLRVTPHGYYLVLQSLGRRVRMFDILTALRKVGWMEQPREFTLNVYRTTNELLSLDLRFE